MHHTSSDGTKGAAATAPKAKPKPPRLLFVGAGLSTTTTTHVAAGAGVQATAFPACVQEDATSSSGGVCAAEAVGLQAADAALMGKRAALHLHRMDMQSLVQALEGQMLLAAADPFGSCG